ncbi:hypothetical protein [Paenibacillus sp. MMS18-CY102]|uniref:hypothetical protein n=1 Tax=Paenibacillus sp. MMS18-CY102 TaxID=2682849 RepID=UPI0013656FC4|nr:hypothetical protein [Paenibacillus sp. MMS18-CY102]MWC29388.1 hypothetical protein [Paenibacillus sp. MMS18-CY102]
MKNKLTITRLAMSAVLLSAVAFPAITNADSTNKPAATAPLNVLASKTETATAPAGTVVAAPAFAVTSFADPAELAKKYAPETVADWKDTLAQYKKLAGDKIIHSGFAIAAPADGVPAPAPGGKMITIQADGKGAVTVFEGKEGELPPLAAPPAGAAATAPAKLVPAKPGQPSADGKVTKVIITQDAGSTDTMAALPALPTLPAGEAGKGTLKITSAPTLTLQEGVAITQIEGGNAIEIQAVSEIGESDLAFINAQIALAEAVQADKPSEIKQALSELLKQYKVQIAELKTETEAAKKTTK